MENRDNNASKTLLDLLILSVREKSSDLHFEPSREAYRARLRIDGSLHTVQKGDPVAYLAIVNRIKVLCHMDIAERRKPQDGGFTEIIDGMKIDFRVSVVPVMDGEKVAIRVLDNQGVDLTPEGLGFSENQWDVLSKLVRKKSGFLILTGPTGSGKTTTMYTLLKTLNQDDRHIITLEDPVEYRIPGVNQIQLNEKIGLSFSSGLRAILRQDPEIIMVGEIRDRETAEIAVRAAITGHLVLSTLHTNDSHGAIIRLMDMGVEPFMIAASLTGVCSQRLVKKLCPICREKAAAVVGTLPDLSNSVPDTSIPSGYAAVGCLSCRGGYSGRVAISETLIIDHNLRQGINLKEDLQTLRSRTPNFVTMERDGFDKVEDGITDLKEIYGVLNE